MKPLAAVLALLVVLPAAAQSSDEPLPVLLVVANQDFYWREYAEPREELEKAGLRVEVAAGRKATCRPHPNTGQGSSSGEVEPDLALSDVDASRYSAIAFVGGWGASSYQFAFPGRYRNGGYNGEKAGKEAANRLIAAFLKQDRIVAGICHGISVLAWARVGGKSPLAGRRTAALPGSPAMSVEGRNYDDWGLDGRWHVETNGGRMADPHSIGDPATADDDVVVDGKIVTAENYDSGREFGRALAREIRR